MALVDFNQTDTVYLVTYPNGGCTGSSLTSQNHSSVTAESGGTLGSTPFGLFTAGSETLVVSGIFKCTVNSGVSWNAGTWTWRLNVTSSNMFITLERVYICRVNSSDTNQATIGSATGLGLSLGSTGVLSGNITGSAQTPSAGDYVGIFFVVSNSNMNNQQISYTPDQVINSPFTTTDRTPRPTSIGHPFIF